MTWSILTAISWKEIRLSGIYKILAKVEPHLHIHIFIPFAKKSICDSLEVLAAKDLSL